MADLKISEMTPAAELTGAELIECVQGGVNVKQELTGLKTWVNDGVQPFSSTLDALSSFNTNGIMVQTDTSEFIGRTITGTASQVTVTNGDGVSGNPTISLPASGVTAATYGSATQVPVLTVNAQGVVTLVTNTAITIPTTFSDSTFRVQDNADATKQIAFEASSVGTGTTKTITMPNANVDLGNLPSVATTNSNTLSGTRTRILGGSSNTVSGTDNVAIGCTGVTLNGIGQIVLGATTFSSRLKCNDITVLGSAQSECTNIKHFLYKGPTASCYLSNAAGQANVATPDTTNCPRATLSGTAGVSLFELRFVSTGWDVPPTFIGSISGCRVFSVHSDGVGGYIVSAVATPYADMATHGLGMTFAITVITAVGGEKLLQIIPTVSGLGASGVSHNYATLDAIYQW